MRASSVHKYSVTRRLNELKIDEHSVLDVSQSRIFKQINEGEGYREGMAKEIGGEKVSFNFFPF